MNLPDRRQFDTCLRDPVAYLDTSVELRSSCLRGVKVLFEFCKACAQSSPVPTGPLTELCTDGFCDEGVWEQVELLNEPVLGQLTQMISNVTSGGVGDLLCKPKAETSDDAVSNSSEDRSSHDVGSDGGDVLDDQDDRVADNGCVERRMALGRRRGGSGEGGRRSVVDDQFFRLAEMEEFVERLEAGEIEEEEGMCATQP